MFERTFIFFSIFLLLIIVLQILKTKSSKRIIPKKIDGEITPITKTIIITGGNAGFGYKCARNIAARNLGFKVIIGCRDQKRAEKAVQDLIKESGNSNISYLLLDLASQQSIRTFCENSELFNPPLFGIVCNAVFTQNSKETVRTNENIEASFGVGHLGHFLLCNLLIPSIQDGGKIVFLSSDLHNPPFVKIEWVDPNTLAFPEKSSKSLSGVMRYCFCKLSNLYCTYELARRLNKKGIKISVNAFNPGMMLDTHQLPGSSAAARFVKDWFGWLFGYTTGRLGNSETSAEQVVDLITAQKWNGITGKYIDRGVEQKSSELSYSQSNAEELWEVSKALTGLERTI